MEEVSHLLSINKRLTAHTEELACLTAEAERAEQAAERWGQSAPGSMLNVRHTKTEDDEQADLLRRTEDEAERIRAEVTEPLTVQAEADGTTYLAAVERVASEHTRTIRAQVRQTWASCPVRGGARREEPGRAAPCRGQRTPQSARQPRRPTDRGQTRRAGEAETASGGA